MIRNNIKRLAKRVMRLIGGAPRNPQTRPPSSPSTPLAAAPEPVVATSPEPDPPPSAEPEAAPEPAATPVTVDAKAVQRALDAHVRDVLKADGSDATVLSIDNTEVVMALEGTASASASARASTRLAIERILRAEVPEVSAVRAEVREAS